MPSDLDRFEFYAQRIRRLEYQQHRTLNPAEAVLQELRGLKGGPLWPNVQSVSWTVKDIPSAPFRFLESLFTPILGSLDIICEFDKGQKMPEDIMTSLSTRCPYLENLRLDLPLGVLDTAMLLSSLRRCNVLQRLSLTISAKTAQGHSPPYTVDSHFLSEIAALPKLAELRVVRSSEYSHDRDVVHPIAFSSLKGLLLDVKDTSSISRMLEDCMFPFLAELSISFDLVSGQPTDILELPRIVRSHISCNNIGSLTVYKRGSRVMEIYSHAVISMSSLHPLLDFRNLHHLEFRPRLAISLTDVDLESFARSWARLHTLKIVGEPNMGLHALPTFRGLAHLVRFCPDLANISVVLGEPEERVPSDLNDLPVSSNRVQLDFNHSVFSDVQFAALWISKMFPNFRRPDRSTTMTTMNLNEVFRMVERQRMQRNRPR